MAALAPGLVCAVVPLVLMSLVLELWKAHWAYPWTYERDALANLMLIKNTLAQGWPLHNPLLGAPFGQDLYDFPVVAGDPMHLLLIRLIGVFSSNPAFVMNVFYLIQFPIISLAALWSMRRLGVPTWPAVACASLYALAPYHFYRGEIHVFLAGYWAVPLGLFLVLSLVLGRPLFRRKAEPGGPGAPLRLAGLAVVCVIIGMSEVYYSVLTLILLGVAIVLALFKPDWRRLAVSGIVAAAIIGVTVGIANAPTIIYHARHGQNSEIQKSRSPDQSEQFGMKVTRLVLPVDNHRIGALARVTRKYETQSPTQLDETAPQALGTVATVGFVALLLIALTAIVPGGRRRRTDPLLLAAGLAVIVVTLVGTSGGFAAVLSYLVSHSIRSWDRYSVFIAFLALLPLALVLAWVRPLMTRRGLGTVPWAVVLGGVVLLGTLDQTGSRLVPAYSANQAQWQLEANFTHAVEARMPRGAEIYQVPYYPFPEWGYDLARPYYHSDTLKWSFGAMEGRAADWPRALLSQPGNVIVPSVAAAGFDGIYVDRALYPDSGVAADKDLSRMLGPPIVISADRRFELYDLRPYAARVRAALGLAGAAALGQMTLHPPRADFGPAFGPTIPGNTIFALNNQRWSTSPTAYLDIDNPASVPRRVRLEATLGVEVPEAKVTVLLPRSAVRLTIKGASGAPFDKTFFVPPGRTRIFFLTNIAFDPARRNYIALQNFRVIYADAYNTATEAAAKVAK